MPAITGIPRLLAATVMLLAAPVVSAQVDDARLQRTSPNLMLETGARTGMCDVLSFSADGRELFAAGDDKVVRVFRVDQQPAALSSARVLRWPILRDHKGAIYAMDRGPDPAGNLLAVAGHGLLGDSVGVLDAGTGQLKQYLPAAGTSREIWSLAFAGDGRQLALGTGRGDVLLWDRQRGSDEGSVRSVISAPAGAENKVRLLRALPDRTLLSVTQDGAIRRTNLDDGKSDKLGQLDLRSVYRVAHSPSTNTLAATGEAISSEATPDTRFTVRLFSLPDRRASYIRLPDPKEIPTAVAFDSTGRLLAIGSMIRGAAASQVDRPGGPFHAVTGGRIHVYDLSINKFVSEQPFDNGSMVEALAWQPGNSRGIASAGGPNHEVRLWNLGTPTEPAAEVRGPGRCLWGVRWSADGKQIAFQDQPSRDPANPNQRGAGPWRVFDLAAQEFLPAGAPFAATSPLDRYQGWRVRCTLNPYVWEIIDPAGKAYPLEAKSGRYSPAMHNLPQCYSFIKPTQAGRPPRLALGHDFGVSLYDLHADGPRLSRVLSGHEGSVTSLAPSPDGRALLTASRDQTLAGWSLADWPSQAEWGASVELTPDGKLRVVNIDLGSPAWETGLLPNDVIVMVLLANRLGTGVAETTWLFDRDGQTAARNRLLNISHAKRKSAAEMAEYLRRPDPAREIVFAFERDGKPQPLRKTSVRQAPLWKLFPARNGEWLAWRWRDYFYNTNAPQADELAGWQVHSNRNLAATPVFYRLSQFPKQFRPDKVKEAFANFAAKPDVVMLADIEPPVVAAQLAQQPGRDAGAVVTVSAEPRSAPQNAADFQNLERVELYVNEYRLADVPLGPNGRVQNRAVPIDKDLLRRGVNHLRVRAWNRGGAHADEVASCDYAFGPERGRLLGLCVGVADYRATAGGRRDLDLYKADVRARELAEALRKQVYSGLYTEVVVGEPLQNDRATPAAILSELRRLAGELKAGPNDTLILFIASHGLADEDQGGAFAFQLGRNSKLYASELRAALEKLPCRRLLLLDACYSGRINHDNEMLRAVTGNIPQLAFAACGPDEAAIYDDEGGGVFTNCLLRYLNAGPVDGPTIRSSDLVRMLSRDVPREAETIMEGHLAQFPTGGRQTPLFYHQPIAGEADLALFGRNRP